MLRAGDQGPRRTSDTGLTRGWGMSRSRNGFLSVSTAVLAVGVAVPVALTNRSGPAETRGHAPREVAENDLPPALARHLDRLKALLGNGGESREGPSSAAE